MTAQDGTLFEFPRFGEGGEQEWLLVELNAAYLRESYLPALARRYLGSDYQWELAEDGHSSSKGLDATVRLLDIPVARGPRVDAGQGRWELAVRHRGGSLETLVARTRRWNLAISAAVLLLILGAVSVLVRFSRQSQQLAELQMNFVAGVSHELRTPLTVIRTAAYNLRGRLAARPDQVERYGALIQSESEKLTALVEQVLRFAGAKAGHVIRAREPVPVEELIEDALRSSRASIEGSELVLERHIDEGLPPVFADNLALQHALQNLLDNALKYGTEASNWLGVFASAVETERGRAVEIRIVDRGPGIPADEQQHIFNPFFRGRRAVQDQVHGTGLGLNLVKMIVEAHQGSIQVKSAPGQGTEFIVRIPAAAPEPDYEFSHSVD
jgi:signal transduction histidine kinase